MTTIELMSLALCVFGLGSASSTIAQDDPLTDTDRKAMVELKSVRETPRAIFHFRAGALEQQALDADVASNVAALEGLEKTLDMHYRGRVHVFLYADADEMKRVTGAEGSTAAFSTGTVSVHQPHDFRGVHEFVHIYALQFERAPDTSGPDLFVTEGLATWLAESDQGVPIHAWAAAYSKAGVLPAILELRRTFPDGAGKEVHPYHVAGSFVGFLLKRYGLAKVKRWYMDSTEAHAYFGEGLARLEREWHEFLASYALAPEHEAHVMQRLGLSGEPMPAAWAKAKTTALFDGKSLAGLVPEDAAKWSVKDGLLSGSNDAPWSHLATTKSFGASIGVRAKLRLVSGNALKLRVNGTREAIFATWSSYATAGEGFSGNDRRKIPVGQWVEIVVVDESGRARVYLDGTNVFDLPGAWSEAGDGSLALGVERGVLEVREWVAFDPR
jgi:hypothetical protein